MKRFLISIFGNISWSHPAWIQWIQHKLVGKRWLMMSGLCTLIAILIAAVFGYRYYQHLPKPTLVYANIVAPPITPEDKVLKPQPLVIRFSTPQEPTADSDNDNDTNDSEDEDSSATSYKSVSLAPLSAIGKSITQGVKIVPNVAGSWVWQSDSQLVFTPVQPWPAGQKYTVRFSQDLFAKKVPMAQWQYEFRTIPFKIKIENFRFSLDLQDPLKRELVATLNFNYPVNPSTLKSQIRLFIQELKNNQLNLAAEEIPFALSFAKDNWTAYLHAPFPKLPAIPRYAQLYIDKGVVPQEGIATQSSVQAKAFIPDQQSMLSITQVNTTIVRNQKDQPEQILTVETSIGVKTNELAKSLQVYLLPKNYPATNYQPEQKDYSWTNPGEVTSAMLTVPVSLTPIPAAHEYETLHSFKFRVDPDRYLYIHLHKGLTSYGNFNLAHNYTSISPAPEYPREINFLHKGALLALSGDKKFSVVVRGIPAVKFTFARVLPEDINHLITQTVGNYQNPSFINDSFDANNISEIFSETRQFDNDPAHANYVPLDLNKYLSAPTQSNRKMGLFLLKAQSWNTQNDVATDVENNRLILITDMGLLVKDNQDGSRDVFVQSITEGVPIAGVKVSILGKNGLPLLSGITNEQGHVSFSSLKAFSNSDQTPTLYLAQKGEDVSFIPYDRDDRQLNYSRFDTSGVYDNREGLTAYLFSDRGIYRPGEDTHLGMIVRGLYLKPLAIGLPLEAVITDPRGNTVLKQKLSTNADGYLTLDYKTTDTALTGQYFVNLYVVKDKNSESAIGSTKFNVEEFQPDKLKMQASFEPRVEQGWVAPDHLMTKVSLWNLYGTPATQRRVAGKLLFAPQPLVFSQYPDFIFTNPLQDPKKPLKVYTENLPDAQTNEKGEAEFKLNLQRFERATYQLTFFAEGFAAEGGRGVSAQTSVLVSPLTYLVGYKTDGDLNYIKQNGQRSVKFIALSPQLKSIKQENLQLNLYRLNTISTLTKQADSTYQYQSVVQEVPVSHQNFVIEQNGSDYSLPTQDLGDYKLTLTDSQGFDVSKLTFSIVGASSQPLARNAELTLKLDKQNYQPGQTIEMQITAPYAGSGLITLERDKVYAYKWFKTNETSTVQTISIPADFVGTGYVNVAFVRDWDSDEIFMNPLSYNVVPFSVVPADKIMNVKLDVAETVRPGQPLNIHYSSDKPGKIIVYAVDEGILQVADYKTPDPIKYYFRKQALTVNTAQIVDQILPKYIAARELSAIGGDGDQNAINRNLNPFKRKNQKPVVYWSGLLDTDPTVRQVTYQVPDYFNGTLQIMAVAAGANSAGSAMKKILSQDYFILTPNVPTFVAPGDDFQVSVTVANNDPETSAQMPITLQLNASSQLQITGASEQKLSIAPHTESTATFNVHVNNQLGDAQLTFIASAGEKTTQQVATLSVRPIAPYQTTVVSGYQTANKTMDITRSMYPNYRILNAAISTNPLILVRGLQDYLDNYPYGCTEQLVSKAFVLLALTQQPGFHDQEKFMQRFKEIIQLLRQRQTSQGGFVYWPNMGDNQLNQFASIYAMDFLTEAKTRGYSVPDDLYASGITYLKNFVTSDPQNMADARLRAYAIYILTRNEIVTTSYITNLQLYLQKNEAEKWHKDITSAYLAAAYKMLKNDAAANSLISGYHLDEHQPITDNFYDHLIANAQYVTILARYFPEQLEKKSSKILLPLVDNFMPDQINSLSAAMSALALSSYAQALNSMTTDHALAIKQITPQGSQLLTLTAQMAEFSADAQKLEFIKNSNVPGYFYQITQAGFDNTLSTQPMKQGIEIYRTYTDADNDSITKADLGSEINAHITVRALKQDYLNNIVIVDLLPGGFEVVPDSIKKSDWDYVDVREDRVIFYGSVTDSAKTINYKIRAVNRGQYSVPPIFATAMYDPKVQARGVTGEFKVQ